MRSLQSIKHLETALIAIPFLLLTTACVPSDDSAATEILTSAATMTSGMTDTSGTEDSSGTTDMSTTDMSTTDMSTTDMTTTDMTTGDGDPETTGQEGCEGYRTEYPAGPYGLAVGSVLADPPGMVRGDGSAVSFFDIYQDTTVVALVIVNAFDT